MKSDITINNYPQNPVQNIIAPPIQESIPVRQYTVVNHEIQQPSQQGSIATSRGELAREVLSRQLTQEELRRLPVQPQNQITYRPSTQVIAAPTIQAPVTQIQPQNLAAQTRSFSPYTPGQIQPQPSSVRQISPVPNLSQRTPYSPTPLPISGNIPIPSSTYPPVRSISPNAPLQQPSVVSYPRNSGYVPLLRQPNVGLPQSSIRQSSQNFPVVSPHQFIEPRSRSLTPVRFQRLPNGELVEISHPEAEIPVKPASLTPEVKSRNLTPTGTTYQITKPHDPTYQKVSISPHRYYQGSSIRPQEGTINTIVASNPTFYPVSPIEKLPAPLANANPRAVENINVQVMDTKQSDDNQGSIYLPQQTPTTYSRNVADRVNSQSPIPRRDRYQEKHSIQIAPQETNLNDTKEAEKQTKTYLTNANSRSQQLVEKSTQTPDKQIDLNPETTKLIEISPSKQLFNDRHPSYKDNGRYSEKKSPPFGERLQNKSFDFYASPLN